MLNIKEQGLVFSPEGEISVLGADKIPLPERSDKGVTGRVNQLWLDRVQREWPHFREMALSWLACRSPSDFRDSPIGNPLTFNGVSLQDEFTLTKSVVRNQVLRTKRYYDFMLAYQYFNLGEEVDRTEKGEVILRITRQKILQLYVVVSARKAIVSEIEKKRGLNERRRAIGERRSLKKPSQEEENRDSDIYEQIMSMKPYRGGPLLTGR